MPPWPNGQGVGLLIRRLRVRVPQGVSFTQCVHESLSMNLFGFAEQLYAASDLTKVQSFCVCEGMADHVNKDDSAFPMNFRSYFNSTAAIAQLGERQTEDLKVPGSIPGLGILMCTPVMNKKFIRLSKPNDTCGI